MTSIHFLTRGHGFGHAAKDLSIITALKRRNESIETVIASYGKGVLFYSSRNVYVHDLAIVDDEDESPEAACRLFWYLNSLSDVDLMVVDEIRLALPITRMLNIRTVYLTHWFYSEIGLPQLDDALAYTTRVLLLDCPDAHTVPPKLAPIVSFTGALAEPFAVTKSAARHRLDLTTRDRVLVVSTGAVYASKEECARHLLNVILMALTTDVMGFDRIYILTDMEDAIGNAPLEIRQRMRCIAFTSEPHIYFAAADLVIAFATFTTMCELAFNRIRTVAVLCSTNPVDRIHAEYLSSVGLVTCIQQKDLCVGRLQMEVHSLMDSEPYESPQSGTIWASSSDIAAELLRYHPRPNTQSAPPNSETKSR